MYNMRENICTTWMWLVQDTFYTARSSLAPSLVAWLGATCFCRHSFVNIAKISKKTYKHSQLKLLIEVYTHSFLLNDTCVCDVDSLILCLLSPSLTSLCMSLFFSHISYFSLPSSYHTCMNVDKLAFSLTTVLSYK